MWLREVWRRFMISFDKFRNPPLMRGYRRRGDRGD